MNICYNADSAIMQAYQKHCKKEMRSAMDKSKTKRIEIKSKPSS